MHIKMLIKIRIISP